MKLLQKIKVLRVNKTKQSKSFLSRRTSRQSMCCCGEIFEEDWIQCNKCKNCIRRMRRHSSFKYIFLL